MTDLSITHTLDRHAGRNCPLSYRYEPADIAALPAWTAHTIYVVGGLYGNTFALAALQTLVERENNPVRIVFNGDFNWFNIDDADFAGINSAVLAHTALRGNVETELSAATAGVGCGCGYPHWVDDDTVQRSNRIMARLHQTASRHEQFQTRLRDLPMFTTAQVGDLRIAIVHGDAHSLAGWNFSLERQIEISAIAQLEKDFTDAAVQVFASSHTCTPVLKRLHKGVWADDAVLINNGAAGMPNFADSHYGLISRISTVPAPVEPLYGQCVAGVHIDALALNYNRAGFQQRFLAQWPKGSLAHHSYYQRIANGPDVRLAQVQIEA